MNRVVLLWLLLITVAAAPLAATLHLALRGSSPSDGERLSTVPTQIRLEFTETVEISVSSVKLRDSTGAIVQLGALVVEEDGHVVAAAIDGPLASGDYRVIWQAVGRDGHPVRGEYTFTIEDGATGVATPEPALPVTSTDPDDGATPSKASPERAAAAPDDGFTSRSPLFAAIRWLMYVGIVTVVGSLGFALVLSRTGIEQDDARFVSRVGRRTATFGLLGLVLLLVSVPLRLLAQSQAVFGDGVSAEQVGALLATLWGTGWMVQATGGTISLAGLLAARGGKRWGWPVAGVGAVMLVISPGLSGHAAAVDRFASVAMVADALHVSGAGLWIGTLAALLFVGLPAARGVDGGRRGRVLARIVRAFSPLAMISAGLLVTTGLIATSLQLAGPTDLWTTAYGRVLLGKMAVVLLVVGLGAYNWRRMRPVMDRPGADTALRRSAGAELAVATVAIILTAVLVALQPPVHTPVGPAHAQSPVGGP